MDSNKIPFREDSRSQLQIAIISAHVLLFLGVSFLLRYWLLQVRSQRVRFHFPPDKPIIIAGFLSIFWFALTRKMIGSLWFYALSKRHQQSGSVDIQQLPSIAEYLRVKWARLGWQYFNNHRFIMGRVRLKTLGRLGIWKIYGNWNVKMKWPRPGNPPNDYIMPHTPAAENLNISGFVLSLDDIQQCPSAHTEERRRLQAILDAVRSPNSGHQTGMDEISRVMRSALKSGARVDLLGPIENAVVIWAEHLLGLANPGARAACPTLHFRSELMRASRSIIDETYLEPSPFWREKPEALIPKTTCPINHETFFTKNETKETKETVNGKIVETYKDRLATYLCQFRRCDPSQTGNTILSRLVEATEAKNDEQVLRDLVGLTGGPVALTVDAAESILRHLVSRPTQWKKYHDLTTNKGLTRSDVMDLVKRVPPNYFVIRLETGQDFTQPKKVVVATGFRRAKFATDGFGMEPHRCLGKDLAIDALQKILEPVLAFQHAAIDPPSRRDLKRRSMWVRFDNLPPKSNQLIRKSSDPEQSKP
jgi:hypothetical protein